MLKLKQFQLSGDWVATYLQDGELEHIPIIGWGLTRKGELIPLDITLEGEICDVRECSNFKELKHKGVERLIK